MSLLKMELQEKKARLAARKLAAKKGTQFKPSTRKKSAQKKSRPGNYTVSPCHVNLRLFLTMSAVHFLFQQQLEGLSELLRFNVKISLPPSCT